MRRIVAMIVLLGACSTDATADPTPEAAPPASFVCDVTLPGEGFVAPGAHPGPSLEGHVWFGTPALYTALPTDGSYGPRKSVFWSVAFPGGGDEPEPEVSVRFERLDDAQPAITNDGVGTNAHTAADGWFMIAGIDPDEPGCWQVTASYKGAALSYVYER